MTSVQQDHSPIYDIAIIGGGVIGISILRSATLAGLRCVLLESCDCLLSKASGSNSGIACTGVDAAPGSLERALIRDSISNIRIFCRDHNVPLRQCGSLVCQWDGNSDVEETSSDIHNGEQAASLLSSPPLTQPHSKQLLGVANESWEAGDSNAIILNREQVLAMEPGLSPQVRGAVHIPGEVVLEPWLFPIALVSHARENGATVYTSFSFCPESSFFDAQTKLWTIYRDEKSRVKDHSNGQCCNVPKFVVTKSVINATGIQCDVLQSRTKDAPKPVWEARPRRGQYRIFSVGQTSVLTRPIQPVPTPRTKGIFVFSTLYNHIVVGPTALDQTSRADITPDAKVATKLTEHVQNILSCFQDKNYSSQKDNHQYIGEYVGIRPGTDRRDYQIHLTQPEKCWIAVAGIRSTGLTASIGIGRYVVDLLWSVLDVSRKCDEERHAIRHMKLTPLPPLVQLVEQFRASKDGSVKINGFSYKVTHPITQLGWTHGSGLASEQKVRGG